MKFHLKLLFLGIFVFAACDVQQENPLSSPTECYEQGVGYYHDGLFRQAQASFKKTLTLLNKSESRVNAAELYGYLGRAEFELGEYRSSLNNLDIAAQRCSQMYDYRLQAQTLEWTGNVYLELRDYDRAVDSYRQSMRLSSALSDIQARAQTELQASLALIDAAKFDQALSLINEVLAVPQSVEDAQVLAEALEQMGEIYRRQGKYPEALNTLNQALDGIGRNEPLLRAKLRIKLGLVYKAQGNPNDAIASFRDAVNILRPRRIERNYEALALFYIGTVYEQNARLGDARKFYSDALEIDRSLGDKIAENYLYLFIIRCNLGLMTEDQRTRAVGELLKSYQQIASKFADCGHRTGEAYTYTLLGSLEESQRDFVTARSMFQKAVDLDQAIKGEYYSPDLHLPFLSELGIASDRASWYDKLAVTLVKLNLRADAVAVLDASQLKSSVDTYDQLDISVRNPQLKDAMKDCRGKLRSVTMLEFELTNMLSGKQKGVDNQKLTALRSQITTLAKDIKEKTDRIVAIQPNYESLLIAQRLKPQDLQMAVPEGTVVLHYLPADNSLYIVALSKSRLDVQQVPIGKDSLLSLVREYQQLLQDPSVYAGVGGEASIGAMTRFEKLSTLLYDYFIRPVDSRFLRNLVIVARNEFKGFPFHALERQDSRGNVKYLIELTGVDYIYSLASLRYTTLDQTTIRTVAAIGNPSGKNWSIDYELHDIRSFYKGASILLGADASLRNLMASKGDVLQLSTDFQNSDGQCDLGSFVCSTGKALGETENVGFEKLADREPNLVVVLSNQWSQGAGLSPLHALLLRMNGTSDVFLNAWVADRKASKFFSESFYTSLAAGLAPGDAYRQALLNLIATREVSHPRSWAQFFHFGVG